MFQQNPGQPLWNARPPPEDPEPEQYSHPEYSAMEHMYTHSKQYDNSDTGTKKGIWNQAYVQNRSKSTVKPNTGINTLELNCTSVPVRGKESSENGAGDSRTGVKYGDVLVGKATTRPVSAKVRTEKYTATKSRPSTAKLPGRTPPPSSIGAYLQLKKAGKIHLPPKSADKRHGMYSQKFTQSLFLYKCKYLVY